MTSSDARKQLLYAMRRVLRPLVRILLRAGIRFDEFAELARGVYVESAIRDGIAHVGTLTREAVALITGVPTQQVEYYIENERELPMAQPTLGHVVTEVLHKWYTHPRYLGPYDVPVDLEFDAPSGCSFTNLVSIVDQNANPGLILDELLKAGSVVRVGENRIRATSRAFINPDGMSPSRVEDFGSTLTRFAQTLEHNFNSPNPGTKRLERFVAADKGLPRNLLSAFEAHARVRTQHFLADLDGWLARHSRVNSDDVNSRAQTGVSVFLYVEQPPEEDPLSVLVQPSRRLRFGR